MSKFIRIVYNNHYSHSKLQHHFKLHSETTTCIRNNSYPLPKWFKGAETGAITFHVSWCGKLESLVHHDHIAMNILVIGLFWCRFEQCGETTLHMVFEARAEWMLSGCKKLKVDMAVNGFVIAREIGITHTHSNLFYNTITLFTNEGDWFCFILKYGFPAILAANWAPMASSDQDPSKYGVTPEGRP